MGKNAHGKKYKNECVSDKIFIFSSKSFTENIKSSIQNNLAIRHVLRSTEMLFFHDLLRTQSTVDDFKHNDNIFLR